MSKNLNNINNNILCYISNFVLLGLFIYKSELFRNSKDSPSQSDNHSEDIENDIEESIGKKRWELKQQLTALNYLAEMELMDFKGQTIF